MMKNVCTLDRCDSYRGCVNVQSECICEDYNTCTNEYCDPVYGCVYHNVDCDDNNSYTYDFCDSVVGCVHEEFVYEGSPEGGY